MITISFENRGKIGLCEYLYNSIKTQILDGTLTANEKLPSKRNLAANLGLSVITVQNAYGQLISEGYIYSIEKKGFFVTDLNLDFEKKFIQQNKIIQPKNIKLSETEKTDFFADFSSNSTSYEKFPFSQWSHIMRQVLNSGDKKLLERISVKGVYELRFAISKYLKEFRNMQISPEQIIIGSGTESLYSMVVQLLGKENLFAVENPGFKKVYKVFNLNGAKVIPLKIDECGINIESLNKTNANVVHLSPSHHFPTGIVMPVKRRKELLSWILEGKNRYIIEDDYDSEFRFNGKPLDTLQNEDISGRVIYINTFSKTISPSFRISFMVLPENMIPEFDKKFSFLTNPVSSFEQFTLSEFILQGYFSKHIIRMKNYYRNLRNSLISELVKSRISAFSTIFEEESGLHFLLKVKTQKSTEQIYNDLIKKRIKLPLLKDFYYSEPPESAENTFLVNYSGIIKEKIPDIVRIFEEEIF